MYIYEDAGVNYKEVLDFIKSDLTLFDLMWQTFFLISRAADMS